MLYFQPIAQTVNFALPCLCPSQDYPSLFPPAIFFAAIALGQIAQNAGKETVRVTVSLNADGSRTTLSI